MEREVFLREFLQEPGTFTQTLPTTDPPPTIVLLCNKNNPLISAQTNGSSLPAAGSLVVEVVPTVNRCQKSRHAHILAQEGPPREARERDRPIRPINSEEVEFTAAPTFPSPDCPPKPGLHFMPEIRRSKATLWVFVCLTHLSIMAGVTAGGRKRRLGRGDEAWGES